MTKRGKSVASLKNLPQFRDKSDAELLDYLESSTFEAKVQARLDKLGEDFDLSDMKSNDHALLKRWASLSERLDEEEKLLKELKDSDQITSGDALREEQRLSSMQRDIIEIQNALNITRVRRKDKAEDNPRVLFEDIKRRAAKFYKERLAYLACPGCGIILSTVNFLYPEEDNEIRLTCKKCGAKSNFTSKDAIEIEKANPYK